MPQQIYKNIALSCFKREYTRKRYQIKHVKEFLKKKYAKERVKKNKTWQKRSVWAKKEQV